MVLRTALVGLDLSDVSRALVEWLPNLQRIGTTRVILFHAIPPEKLEHVAGYPVDRLEEELTREALEKLRAYAEMLAGRGFDEVEVHEPRVGEPAPLLAEEAERLGADYIVVADRGKGLLRRIILGSTADELLNLSRVPVLVAKGFVSGLLKPRLQVPPSPFEPERPVLAAVEWDEYLEDVKRLTVEVASRTGQRVVLLHVLEEDEPRDEASKRLERLAGELRAAGIDAEPLLLGPGRPDALIAREAEERRPGLLVLGRGGGGGLLRGGVADSVSRRVNRHLMVATRRSQARG